jgi:hypothetical protein
MVSIAAAKIENILIEQVLVKKKLKVLIHYLYLPGI